MRVDIETQCKSVVEADTSFRKEAEGCSDPTIERVWDDYTDDKEGILHFTTMARATATEFANLEAFSKNGKSTGLTTLGFEPKKQVKQLQDLDDDLHSKFVRMTKTLKEVIDDGMEGSEEAGSMVASLENQESGIEKIGAVVEELHKIRTTRT